MHRRGFLRELAKGAATTPLVLAAPLALFAGCDDEEGGQSGGGGQGGGACNTSANISANHGHVLNVPAADVQAGVARSYDIQGSSAHPHTVQLSANLMVSLRENGMVTVVSSSNSGHSHSVTIRCV